MRAAIYLKGSTEVKEFKELGQLAQTLADSGYEVTISRKGNLKTKVVISKNEEDGGKSIIEKLKEEIVKVAEEEAKIDKTWAAGIKYSLTLIDKCEQEVSSDAGSSEYSE